MNFNRMMSGYVEIILVGVELEKLFNVTWRQGLTLWDVKRLAADRAICKVPFAYLWPFLGLVRQHHVRIKISQRVGMPFVFSRLKKRKGMFLGCCLFFSLIYLTLSFVWSYDVTGNEHYSDQQIIGLIQSYGIVPGARIKNFDYTAVQKQLLIDYPDDFIWVDMRPVGTSIHIEIKEKEKPDVGDTRPAHLVARRNGRIKELLVFKGTSQVTREMNVQAGQVLIAGLEYLDRQRNEAGVYDNTGLPKLIRAKGVVYGEVDYEALGSCKLLEMPLYQTGRWEEQWVMTYNQQRFVLRGMPQSSYSISRQEITTKNLFTWQNYRSPICFIKTIFWEQVPEEKNYTIEDAYYVAVERAREKLRDKIEGNSKFVAENILLIPQDDSQRIQVQVTWTVLENLAQPQLITNNSSSS